MQNSITDALNLARHKLASTITSTGDPYKVAMAKAVQDTMQSYKTAFEALLKG